MGSDESTQDGGCPARPTRRAAPSPVVGTVHELVNMCRWDTVGGMTGVTYTQIHDWPEVTHRAVYVYLRNLCIPN
jgi:hypothetical protein